MITIERNFPRVARSAVWLAQDKFGRVVASCAAEMDELFEETARNRSA